MRQAVGISSQDFFTMAPGECIFIDEPAISDIARMFPNETQLYANYVNSPCLKSRSSNHLQHQPRPGTNTTMSSKVPEPSV
jgi:hypothetical protein